MMEYCKSNLSLYTGFTCHDGQPEETTDSSSSGVIIIFIVIILIVLFFSAIYKRFVSYDDGTTTTTGIDKNKNLCYYGHELVITNTS